MPRRSAEDLATSRPVAPTPAAPEMPEGLTLPEQRMWKGIIGSKPAGWFDAGGAACLLEYVRAACMCDVLASQIQTAAPERVGALLALRDKESRRLGALGSKLRLLPVSRYRPDAAAARGPVAGAPRPWRATT